jgi:hypothetical protein
MRPERRRQLALGAIAIGLTVTAYVLWPQPAGTARPASNLTGGKRSSASPAGGVAAPDVHLEALAEAHERPGAVERNLFKFKPKPAPPPPVYVAPPPVMQPVVPAGPPPPPPIAPIPLKFIGVLQSANSALMAILSDGRGAPMYGKEGDTVLGQYKILRIATDSIEMAYIDGRGRQTIRLSGS